jgi:hypothetical protein
MRLSPMKSFAGAAAALALCMSPTMATAATTAPLQSVSPLVAVSIFGTQASAQQVCNPATAAAAAGAAVAAQGQSGCVLPATDAAPPPPQGALPPAAIPPGGDFGINWLLAGLGALALLAGIYTLFHDDDDDGRVLVIPPPVSPA